jgi:hypothetical protein
LKGKIWGVISRIKHNELVTNHVVTNLFVYANHAVTNLFVYAPVIRLASSRTNKFVTTWNPSS